ncbi:MAG TPA: BREX system P-loop protein BrxC, partial [Candidatus Wallbacteria bacterium]|nr:BREX system P-loop protein BrxC [Candidatus Wallbacteria bacterium]
FPIQINLESSDIREICYRRLLGKSAAGEKELNSLFDQHGQALRHNTKLENAKYYDSDFNKDSFAKLYPFLPSHFDILLHLLGALAKSTGGIGLRSAIKVVQDILIDNMDGNEPIAEKPIGTLVTSTTLYDALEKDIRRASQSIYNSVEKVKVRFPGGGLHLQIAKTVAILQIMNNLPTTITNVTSLLHPSVAAPGMLDEVKKAANELVSDTFVPFGEQDGQLRFFSEKLNEIEKEKSQLPVRTVETRRIFSESLKEIFTPLPSVNLHGSLNVKSGVKTLYGSVPFSLAGDNETLQMHVEFADSKDYETQKASAINESRSKNSQNVIFLICRTAPEIEEKLADIFRCREICQRFRTEPDQEIKEYCASQNDRSIKLAAELQHLLKKLLSKGSFVFRGQITAVDSLDNDILESSKKNLAKAAPQVFDRYQEAPVRAETGLAEKFLRTENLNLITVQIDPMGLIKKVNGKPTIDIGNKALISIKDYIEKNGSAEGKRLLEIFSDAPFGWSQDTLRYLLAALLISGEIKLKVAGREVTVNGQSAIDALKSNVSFKNVGVSLRNEKPSMDVLARAAERLTELTGEQIIPLENDIGKAAVKHLSQFQTRFAPLGGKLSSLGISGEDKIQSINKDIADILFTDGSDVYKLFGGVESELCEKLKWAGEIEKSFSHGLDKTLSDLKKHYDEINDMPDCDIPQKLKNDLSDEFEKYKDIISGENFYGHSTDLNSLLTSIKSKVRKAAEQMIGEQKKSIDSLKQELVLIPFWDQFNLQEQNEVISDIENLEIKVESDLHGIRQLIKHDMVIYNKLKEYKQKIISEGQTRHVKKLETEREKAKKQGKQTLTREIKIPASVKSIEQLDDILTQLNKLKNEFAVYSKIEINIKIEG